MISPVRGDYRRLQAEIPLIGLFKFAEPALDAAFQIVSHGMSDEELNSRARANYSADRPVFSLANRTSQDGKGGNNLSISVSISSPLFERSGFPFVIDDRDNLSGVIQEKLP